MSGPRRRWLFRMVPLVCGAGLGRFAGEFASDRADAEAAALGLALAALGLAVSFLETQLYFAEKREEVWKRVAEREYPLQRVEP